MPSLQGLYLIETGEINPFIVLITALFLPSITETLPEYISHHIHLAIGWIVDISLEGNDKVTARIVADMRTHKYSVAFTDGS